MLNKLVKSFTSLHNALIESIEAKQSADIPVNSVPWENVISFVDETYDDASTGVVNWTYFSFLFAESYEVFKIE